MRNDITLLNRFVETLSHESSAFDYPCRGQKLVIDRKVSRPIVLDIVRGKPSERFAEALFPFLNLVDEERLLCALAAPTETDLTRCPVVTIDAAGKMPYLLASSVDELVGLFPWGYRLLVEIAEYVSRYNRTGRKGATKTPEEKFAAQVSKARRYLDPDLPARVGFASVTLAEDPVAAIVSAHRQHHARLL